ncbi:MAG: hypothetical protein Q9225_006628, partial [Loekoesia sp. 1 TL-2023]
MPVSSLLERSRVSLEELRSYGLRARASTSFIRLHLPCLGSGGVGGADNSGVHNISRSFTAAGHTVSARRGALDLGTSTSEQQHPQIGASPIEIQQFRYPPSGRYRAALHSGRRQARRQERFVASNRDPNREDEYLPYPSLSSSDEGQSADAGNAEANTENGDARAIGARTRSRETRLAYSTGNDAWTRTIENAAREPPPSSRIHGTDGIPTWEVDVEAQLEGEVQQLVQPRDFGFGEIVAERERRLQPPRTAIPRPRRRSVRRVHDLERRRGRVFDDGIDYSVLRPPHPLDEPETVAPHLSGQRLESRYPLLPWQQVADTDQSYTKTDTTRYRSLNGARRHRRHLPHPPPPPSSFRQLESVHARILDAETGREVTYPPQHLERRDEPYRPQPRIRSDMFPPIVGGPAHATTTTRTQNESFSDLFARAGMHVAAISAGVTEAVASRVMS